MQKAIAGILILSLCTSCATARGRFILGAVGGAVAGGGTAVLLSPNKESQGLNALVFGLAGALVGGLASAFLLKDPKPTDAPDLSLRGRELGIANPEMLYTVPTNSKLPLFVKERLQPVVVEESVEPDTVSEDGTLHEPHKIYRIQRQAELYSKPTPLIQQPTAK